jgi:hypothetical protein
VFHIAIGVVPTRLKLGANLAASMAQHAEKQLKIVHVRDRFLAGYGISVAIIRDLLPSEA